MQRCNEEKEGMQSGDMLLLNVNSIVSFNFDNCTVASTITPAGRWVYVPSSFMGGFLESVDNDISLETCFIGNGVCVATTNRLKLAADSPTWTTTWYERARHKGEFSSSSSVGRCIYILKTEPMATKYHSHSCRRRGAFTWIAPPLYVYIYKQGACVRRG